MDDFGLDSLACADRLVSAVLQHAVICHLARSNVEEWPEDLHIACYTSHNDEQPRPCASAFSVASKERG